MQTTENTTTGDEMGANELKQNEKTKIHDTASLEISDIKDFVRACYAGKDTQALLVHEGHVNLSALHERACRTAIASFGPERHVHVFVCEVCKKRHEKKVNDIFGRLARIKRMAEFFRDEYPQNEEDRKNFEHEKESRIYAREIYAETNRLFEILESAKLKLMEDSDANGN